jgi:hypothetical protein
MRSRRWVLVAGLALGATACTLSDPAVRPAGGASSGTSGRPTPTPTPFAPGLDRDRATEAALALGALALRGRTGADQKRRRDLLSLMARCHQERAAALAAPDPTSRPTAEPGPSAGPSGTPSPSRAPAVSTARLVADERAVMKRYRAAALAASGSAALLWGSMAVASSSFAAALDADDPPASADVATHRPLALVSDVDAVSALVASLHAVVWGYQLAVGRLPAGSAHDRALDGLRGRRRLQDRLVGQLLRAGVEVPAAAPAYDPDPEVRDAADARLLIRRMESRLLPFCGVWLAAAARPADRRLALDTLEATRTTATTWGAPLTAWPGWED